MNDKDFAGTCAYEAVSRAARILPVLQSYLEINELPPLTEVQQVALGSVVLQVFDGITDTLERMCEVGEVLNQIGVAGQVEAWLRDQTEQEPLQ